MHKDQKQQLKTILNCLDPDALSQLLPDCSQQDLHALFPLLQAHRDMADAIQQKTDNRRGLSRQIGNAKKQKLPVDSLLAAMRDITTEIKHMEVTQADRIEKIRAYLPTEKADSDDTPATSSGSRTQRYKSKHSPPDITIQLLSDNTDDWDHYVQNHPAGTLYHQGKWRAVIRDVFGHESMYLLAKDETGVIIGVLPLVRLTSRLFGDFMVSMPYFNYGGAIGDSPAVEAALMADANRQARSLALEHIEYRDDIARSELPERTNKVNMILELPDDEEQLWEQFTPKLRSQIRRPQRENTDIRQGGTELLADFYRVFARNMRDLGTPVYGKNFFSTILSVFPDSARLLIVYLEGKPVAGAFLIGYKNRLEIPWASSIRRVNHLSVNMLMYWEVLRFAIRNKYRSFDFGRSSRDSGTYRFKQQWGAQPKQLYWHYWLNNREMPTLNPTNPKYQLMINIWKKLPIWITRVLGPLIVRNLP